MWNLPHLHETIGRSIVSGSSQCRSSYDERYEGRATSQQNISKWFIQITFSGISSIPMWNNKFIRTTYHLVQYQVRFKY